MSFSDFYKVPFIVDYVGLLFKNMIKISKENKKL
jgi:hypothetical protein